MRFAAVAGAVVLAAGLQGCAGRLPAADDRVIDASVSELLARPDVYVGKRVRAHGHVVLEFEGTALWADAEAHESFRLDRVIWIDGQGYPPALRQRLTGRLGSVTGVFAAGNCGHMGAAKGGLDDVTIIEVEGEVFRAGRSQSSGVCFNF